MAFRVGQKVVFVNSDRIPGERQVGPNPNLKLGAVYTVRELAPEYLQRFDCCGIRIEEYVPPLFEWKGVLFEPAFLAIRFRPVVSTDTGMAVLEQIRRDVTNKELRPIFEDEQV